MKVTKKDVEKANIEFFSLNALNYNKEEPNYLPENRKRVKKILQNISKNGKHNSLLDVGCGTGFILDLAYPFFNKLYGVDLTEKMLEHVNLHGGKVKVLHQNSENLSFENNSFDVITSYGFLHHLHRLKPTLKEIYRCLNKNGIFYSDQDPNYYFWQHISKINLRSIKNKFVKKEVLSVIDPEKGFRWNEMKGFEKVGKKKMSIVEYQKVISKGIKEEKIRKLMMDIGFRKVNVFYEWYLGEGHIIHEVSPKTDEEILKFLKDCLPITRGLFKYLRIEATK